MLALVRDHREKIGARHSDAYDSNAARRIQFNAYRQPNKPFLPEHDSEVPSKPLTRVVLRLHVWIEEPEGGASSLKAGDTLVFFFEWGWERDVVHSKNKCNKTQKAMAKGFDTSVLVRCVIDGDYILQNFGGEDTSHLSKGT